ncbi:CASP-like protein [Rhynchospora pubera]|uniref:CASP-like protein n=1 Tax=Rhynchospora pubera TaxID=906938 RepID=A0AAV8C2G0_9POAL|nr:CASP-like protein [Rhynchospora pubera]
MASSPKSSPLPLPLPPPSPPQNPPPQSPGNPTPPSPPPPQSPENPTPPSPPPPQSPENPTPPSPPPPQSPENPTPPSPPPPQSPENPTPPPPPPPLENPTPPSPPPFNHASPQPSPDNHSPRSSPPFSPSSLAIVLRSPDKPTTGPDQSPNSNNASSAVTIGSLLATTELTVAKAAANGGGSVKSGLLAPNPWKFKRDELRRLELGLRVSALVLCVISFSLVAADTVPGWAGDSFIRYQEYRYLLSVNVICFMYSAFQFTAEVHQTFTKRHFISRPIGYCFNLAMDQIFAYMLVSASSAATSQNYIWMSRFGGDKFTKIINASVSMSFLAFSCLAFSSVISAHHLFSSIS